jgi:signal transduction histidine kinase
VIEPGHLPTSSAADAWGAALQALASHVAHDLRNALNAVAVNLEVVRGRSARGADPSAIAPFAATAATQFEAAAAAVEALLGFSRPEPEPADVAAITARLARLLAIHEGQPVDLSSDSARHAATSAPADVVRALVARSVLSAVGSAPRVACAISVRDGIFLHVTGGDAAPALEPALAAIALASGIRLATRGDTLELTFPPAATDVSPFAPA